MLGQRSGGIKQLGTIWQVSPEGAGQEVKATPPQAADLSGRADTRREGGGLGRCASRRLEHPCMLVGSTRGPRIPRRPPRSTALIASPSPDFKRRGQRAPTGPVTGGGARRPSPGLAHSLHLAAAGPVAAAWPHRNERAGSRPPATHAVAAAVAARGPDGTGPTCHWHALEEKSPFLRARKIGCALL